MTKQFECEMLCDGLEECQRSRQGEVGRGDWELREAYSRGDVDGADVTNVLNTTLTPPTAGFLPNNAHAVGM